MVYCFLNFFDAFFVLGWPFWYLLVLSRHGMLERVLSDQSHRATKPEQFGNYGQDVGENKK